MEAGFIDAELGYHDYRQPDVLVAKDEHCTDRGVEHGCELVVEVRSPGDDTYLKFDWYLAHGTHEILVVEPETRAIELYRAIDGAWQNLPAVDGTQTVACLPLRLRTVSSPNGAPLLELATPADRSTV
jgi:Uma2 family endonuclease